MTSSETATTDTDISNATAPQAGTSTAEEAVTVATQVESSPDKEEVREQAAHERLPVRMMNDRILVKLDRSEEERRSTGGILIPATAQLGKRLAWAEVQSVGPNVRSIQEGDHVLFNPEDVYEVEVRADTFVILRERDIHALAAERLEEGHTGLYL